FFLYTSAAPRDLHSFPTRRSSDLGHARPAPLAREVPGGSRARRVARGDERAPAGPWPARADARGGQARVRGRMIGAAAWPANSRDRKSTRLNSSHVAISYAVFCLK